MKRLDLLEAAGKAVSGPREADYGPPVLNFTRIARLWSVILDQSISAGQVALCMDALKTARLIHKVDDLDGWMDKAGYAACGAEITRAGEPSTEVHDLRSAPVGPVQEVLTKEDKEKLISDAKAFLENPSTFASREARRMAVKDALKSLGIEKVYEVETYEQARAIRAAMANYLSSLSNP